MASLQYKDTFLNPSATDIPDKFPDFSKPCIVGHFSVDKDRKYNPDARNCKYITNPNVNKPVNFDLNKGYENVVHKSEECVEERLVHLLTFISKNLPILKNADEDEYKWLSVDIVCFRGLLRSIMCSPYEPREPWTILATKYKGTVYLCNQETEKARMERLSQSQETKRILSYGFKFEQYMIRNTPTEEPKTDEPVIESEEFCCLFRAKLDNSKILYGAEMDGILSNENIDMSKADLNQLNFIELKVKLREERPNQRKNFLRFKLRNWWCQSFLVNIQRIIVGVRDKNGIVSQLSDIDVKNIPKQVQNFWSPAVCMEFCRQFISLVKLEMRNVSCPYTVYKFDYNPKVSTTIKLSVHKNRKDYYILPEWYIKLLT